MADNFDPDKYLAETSKVEDAFDPDAYLAETSQPEEIGTIETAARSLGQGATMGFLDEIMAAGKATTKDIGQALGLSEPSEAPVTFDEQGRPIIPKDSGKGYREELKKQRDITKQIREESPVLSTGLEIAGGIAPTLLTGGAGAAAQLGKAVSKGGVSTIGAIGKAAKEGAKFGGISALGESEAEAPTDLVKDVAVGAGLGAGLGAAMPIAGQTLKGTGKLIGKAVGEIPGAEAISLGYQAGKKGLGIGQEDILEEGMRVAKKLSDKITKVFQDSGMDRKKAMELAEQANVRINAGELLDDVLEEIAETGATGLNIDAKKKLYDQLSSLKKGYSEAKQYKKLEMKAAKQALKDEEAYGSVVETTSEINRPLDTILPLSEGKGDIQGIRTKFSVRDPAGDIQTYAKNVLQEIQENPVKLKEFDTYSLSPSEAKLFKESIDELVGDLGRSANPQESIARGLSAEVDRRIKDAVAGVSDSTKTMSKVFRGAEKLGVSEPGRTSEYALEDSIDKFAKKLLSSGNAAEIDKRSAFKAFRSASPEFSEVIDEAEFVSKLNEKLGGMTEGVRTTNIRGLLGTAEGGAAKLASIAGKVSNKATKVIQPVTKVANKVGQFTDTQFNNAANSMLSSTVPGVQALGKQLQFALQQEGPVKNAAIWSLSQQPAFREATRQFLNAGEEATSDVIGTESMSIGEPARVPQGQEDNPPNNPNSPEAGLGLAVGNEEEEESENLDNMPFKEAFETHYQKVKDLPAEQRPTLKWKGKEYSAVKANEVGKNSNFFKTQKNVNLDVDKDLLDSVEKVARDLGYEEILISSGKRDLQETQKILNQRKRDNGLGNLSEAESIAVDEILLRGKTPEKIEYPQGNWYNNAKRRLEEVGIEGKRLTELLENIGKVRSSFGGYESTHLKGGKVDIPRSYFVEKYGDREGHLRADEFIKKLRESGHKVIDERDQGQHGVIDIKKQPMGEPVSMDKLQELQKNLNAHQKYVQSGGSAIYSSTGDRLMGNIDSLDIAPELKQEAQDAVIDGDIPKLRSMLEQLRNIS